MFKFLLYFVIACFFVFGFYRYNYPWYNWTQKITITVDTPTGFVSSSATSSIQIYDIPGWIPLNQSARSYKLTAGEAVVVDLGEGQYLFGLLKGVHRVAEFELADKNDKCYANGNDVGFAPCVVNFKGIQDIEPSNYPILVTFDDISDPASVKEVDPNDLAATFGEGYSLKSITLEITDDPVTEGEVEKVLGWLNDIWPNTLDGQRYHTINSENRLANSLTAGNFSTEIKK